MSALDADRENYQRLKRAFRDAGMSPNDRDDDVMFWLAGWEPATVEIIAGWIDRARESRSEQK